MGWVSYEMTSQKIEYPESFLKQKIEASKKWLPTRRHVGTHPESLERARVNAPNETGPHESQTQKHFKNMASDGKCVYIMYMCKMF